MYRVYTLKPYIYIYLCSADICIYNAVSGGDRIFCLFHETIEGVHVDVSRDLA